MTKTGGKHDCYSRAIQLAIAFACAFAPFPAAAHGGVVADQDLCIIQIGVFRAHFTVYQPMTRASEEFCEDVPDVSEALFVLDFLHDSLREVPIDFRIIKDVQGRTIYASWADVQSLDDLESATVYYQSPRLFPDNAMNVTHQFSERGWYTGIVTTRHPTKDIRYQAVFGFHVGRRDAGYWPLMVLIFLAVQLHYWVSSGACSRWRQKRINSGGLT